MPETSLDISAANEWLGSARTLISLFKEARALLPKSEKRDEIEERIRVAEQALLRADARLAQELGYQLCQCEFPPRIMLWRETRKSFICPNESCGAIVDMSDSYTPTSELGRNSVTGY